MEEELHNNINNNSNNEMINIVTTKNFCRSVLQYVWQALSKTCLLYTSDAADE